MHQGTFSDLRVRLLILALLVLAPAGALTLYTVRAERQSRVAAVQGEVLRLTRLVAAGQDQLIDTVQQVLETLAQMPEVGEAVAGRCPDVFRRLLERHSGYANLGLVDLQGDLVCSGRPIAGPVNFAERPFFQQALRTRGFAVGQYLLFRPTQTKLVNFGYPVADGTGKVKAVVLAAVDLAWINQTAAAIELPDDAVLIVFDRDRTVLARAPDADRWLGRPLEESVVRTLLRWQDRLAEISTLDGIPRMHSVASLKLAPQYVFVTIGLSERAALIDADARFSWNLLALGLLGVIGLAAAWIVGDHVIVRHVKHLMRVAEQVREGDLGARANVQSGGEIGLLARSFNAVAEQFAARVRTEREAKDALAERVTELNARRREADRLNELGELLQACYTVADAYAVLGRMLPQFFPDHPGAVLIINASDVAEVVAPWGALPAGYGDAFAPSECWALRRGRTHVVEDTSAGLLCSHVARPLPAAYLCIPLMAHGETLGVFYVSSGSGTSGKTGLGDEPQRLAAAVAEDISLAVANLRLRDSLRNQSIRDPLTGLFNRRFMEETLEREIGRAVRAKRPMGVMMLDLDGFKRLNDTFGHDAGDAVLKDVSRLLTSSLRKADVVCRYGGEEFVLILPDASLMNTRDKAEQLRDAFKTIRVSAHGQAVGPVTASIGVAALPEHGTTGPSLLSAADVGLYQAKAAGGNQVVVSREMAML